VEFRLYRTNEMSEELWQSYASLRNARSIYDDPFFDPDFAKLMGEVREDTRIAIATDQDEIVAVWALHERPGNWARPVGGPFSDWHGPILKEGSQLCPTAFLSGLGFSGMTIFGFLPVPHCPVENLERVGANLTDLSQGWDAFITDQQLRWPKHYKKMRRLYRNVDRDFETYTFNWDDQRQSSYDRLLELKRMQFARTGYHDVLKADWSRSLIERLRVYEGPRMRLRMTSLFYDDQHAASELNLQSDKVMHGWLTGFEQEVGHYSPGNMLVQEMLERMSQEGVHIYDAGPGLDHYKRHYSNIQVPVDSGVLRGTRSGYSPSRLAGNVWRMAERQLPGKASHLMGRARRRMDQIALAEPKLGARVMGVFGALSQRDL